MFSFFFINHLLSSTTFLYSVLSVPTSPPPRPPPPDIPKSPPKWPLRPGVMVHVKCDTKLSASRTQSPASVAPNANSSSNQHNVSYASPILSQSLRSNQPIISEANSADVREIAIDVSPPPPPTLPARNLLDKFSTKFARSENVLLTRECADGIEDHNGSTAVAANNNDELINFTSSSLIERILGRLRWRRERTKRNVGSDIDDGTIMTKSNKRAVNLIRGATGWFGSGKSTNSSTGLFDKRHQFNGITCSDGGKYIHEHDKNIQH